MIYAFNQCSRDALADMPKSMRDTIKAMQEGIEAAVLRVFPSARSTSGFRCTCENFRCGGKSHSLHLVGMARDYGRDPRFPRYIPGFNVIFEDECVHVEYSA